MATVCGYIVKSQGISGHSLQGSFWTTEGALPGGACRQAYTRQVDVTLTCIKLPSCVSPSRRVAVVATAVTAIKAALAASQSLAEGGDDKAAGPPQSDLLLTLSASAANTAECLKALQAAEAALDWPANEQVGLLLYA